jgi:predicted nucleic acid-binding protein
VITAVDSNVLIDVLGPDPVFGPRSAQALRDAIQHGGLVACDVVWAEVGARFPSVEAAQGALSLLTISFSALDEREALDAGATWAEYRRRGGRRERVVADFLVGSHARARADRLLTRDRGFFRTYYADLEIVDPSATA